MKRKITIDELVCDFCGKNKNVYDHCLSCEKHICLDCSENVGEDFKHGVHFSGSGDGYFCNSCMAKMPERFQPIFFAYLKIKQLRNEEGLWWKDFQNRSKEAETNLERLQSKFTEGPEGEKAKEG